MKQTAPLLASALSIAVLSFLGFDGIATLAEEATGGRRSVAGPCSSRCSSSRRPAAGPSSALEQSTSSGRRHRVRRGAVPLVGAVIIGYVLINADVKAQISGLAWLVLGGVVCYARSRRVIGD